MGSGRLVQVMVHQLVVVFLGQLLEYLLEYLLGYLLLVLVLQRQRWCWIRAIVIDFDFKIVLKGLVMVEAVLDNARVIMCYCHYYN